MQDIEMKALYQQVGEVLRGLRALSETIDIRHAQAEKMHDTTRADLSVLRQDQRDLEEKLDCVICVMQHDLEELRMGAVVAARSIDELLGAVRDVRKPVAEIIALRSRAAGLILGLGIFGSAVLWLAEPFYRWSVEHQYFKQ